MPLQVSVGLDEVAAHMYGPWWTRKHCWWVSSSWPVAPTAPEDLFLHFVKSWARFLSSSMVDCTGFSLGYLQYPSWRREDTRDQCVFQRKTYSLSLLSWVHSSSWVLCCPSFLLHPVHLSSTLSFLQTLSLAPDLAATDWFQLLNELRRSWEL